MAAAAFKVTLVAALGAPNGERKMVSMTVSDVNGEYWLHPSGASEIALHGTSPVYIVDTILSAAGTDCSQSEFYISGTSTGVKLLHATSLSTAISRPFQQAPLKVPAGQALKIKQLT